MNVSRPELEARIARYQNEQARTGGDDFDSPIYDHLMLEMRNLPGDNLEAMKEAARARRAEAMTAAGPHRVLGGWLKIAGVVSAAVSMGSWGPSLLFMGAGALCWGAGTYLVDRGVAQGKSYTYGDNTLARLEWAERNLPEKTKETDTTWLQPAQVTRADLQGKLSSKVAAWVDRQPDDGLDRLYDRAVAQEDRDWQLQEGVKILDGLGSASIFMGLFNHNLSALVGLGVGIAAKVAVHKLRNQRPTAYALEMRGAYSHLAAADSVKRAEHAVLAKEVIGLTQPPRDQAVGETDQAVTLGGVTVKKRENLTDA